MIPAHHIRGNASSRWPQHFLWLDTETVFRIGKRRQKVMTWRCGVTCFDGWDSYRKAPRPPAWARHDTPADLWRYITYMAPAGRRLVLIAHNLGFDARAACMFTLAPEWGWTLEKVGIHRDHLTVTWRRPDRASLVCVDSHSWLPHSLARIGELVGIPKLPDPAEDDTEGWWLRCAADVLIMRTAMKECWDRLREDDSGTWQKTGAGMSFTNWRHAHYTHQVTTHDNFGARDAEEAAMYTGRAEAWRHGDFSDEPYLEYDLGLAYARIAQQVKLPVSLESHWVKAPPKWEMPDVGNHRHLLRAAVETELPILPHKTCDGIMWPVGKFVGWWWDTELSAALGTGARVKVTEAWRYRSAPMLKAWADWIIPAVEDPAAGYTPVQRAMLKHWSRALIGKFAMRFQCWEPWGENPAGDVCLMPTLDHDTGQLVNIMLLGDRSMISTHEKLGDDTFPAVQGVVMAECRFRLWSLMWWTGLGNVYYVDTDSVITDAVGEETLLSRGLDFSPWAVRPKSSFEKMTINGPRQLIVDQDRRFSGVPRSWVADESGTLHGELWESFEEAIRHGRTDQVITIPGFFTPTPTDKRREHLPDGTTADLVMG